MAGAPVPSCACPYEPYWLRPTPWPKPDPLSVNDAGFVACAGAVVRPSVVAHVMTATDATRLNRTRITSSWHEQLRGPRHLGAPPVRRGFHEGERVHGTGRPVPVAMWVVRGCQAEDVDAHARAG